MTPDPRIVRFLRRHHVLVLATAAQETPWCADVFYAYDHTRNELVFSSDQTTRHGREMLLYPDVAGSVVLETRVVGRVQGLQLCGRVERGDEQARKLYLRRFPYASLTPLTLWRLRPVYMKYTDNTLGFGTKLIWNQENEASSS